MKAAAATERERLIAATALDVVRVLESFSRDDRHRILIATAVLLGHDMLALALLERQTGAR